MSRAEVHPRTSTIWLAFAVVATVLSVASLALGYSLMLGDGGDIAPAVAEDPDPFVLIYTRLPGGSREWAAYGALTTRLSEALGRPVAVRFALSIEESDALLSDGSADAAFLSIRRYLIARRTGSVDLVATPVISGRTLDAAVVMVRADSRFQSLDDLRGSRVSLSSPASIGGYGYLVWRLENQGETLSSFFASAAEGTSQDANLRRLADGEFDATCVNRSQLASWPSGLFRVIETSPEFGMPPFVVSRSVDAETRAIVEAVVLGMEVGEDIEPQSQIDGFVITAPAAYSFAQTVMDAVDRQAGGANTSGGGL